MAGHKVFINLAVKDPARSQEFFAKLGIRHDPSFTDANAVCLLLGDGAFAMLLKEEFFSSFTNKRICDTATHSEALVALSCDSRAAVDQMVHTALEAGGKPAMPAKDHGFMYIHSFYDLDGHHWEVFWMAEKPSTAGSVQ
jgi:hypothetical protein